MPPETEHLKDEGSRPQVMIAGGVAGLVSRCDGHHLAPLIDTDFSVSIDSALHPST